MPDLNRTRSTLGYLSIDELMDETEKLTGISTGDNSNHDIAPHPAHVEVNSSAEVKMRDLGVEVQGLGSRTEEHLKEAQKPRAARLWGSLQKKLQRVASPSKSLERATSAQVQSKSPFTDPRWLPDSALARLRRNGGEWYEKNVRGGDGHSGNDSGYGEGQEGKDEIRSNNREGSGETEESGHQDAGSHQGMRRRSPMRRVQVNFHKLPLQMRVPIGGRHRGVLTF